MTTRPARSAANNGGGNGAGVDWILMAMTMTLNRTVRQVATPRFLKQPDEPGERGEDEVQLIEGQGKQHDGQPLLHIGRIFFRCFEPE